MRPFNPVLFVVLLLILFSSPPAAAHGALHLTLSSSTFTVNGMVSSAYTCDGTDESPALVWNGVPSGTKSLVLIVKDTDAPNGDFVHWTLYNLPAAETYLGQNVPKSDILPDGAMQGLNSAMTTGYMGPCPPPGKPHHYHFHLYALNVQLTGLKPGNTTADEVERAAQGHILASTDLVAVYGRQ